MKQRKLQKLQELQNFARPAKKIDAEMQMSRWKAINETAKITKITKLQELPNFARPTTKIDGQMKFSIMSRIPIPGHLFP